MDEYDNLNLDNLGQHISKDVELAKEHTDGSSVDLERERIKLEEKRIRQEERIAERMAERDENVAAITTEAEHYKSLLDSFIEQFRGLSAGTIQHVEVESPTPIMPASEDVTEDESEEDNDIAPALPPAVEEIGGSSEETEPEKEEEVNNASAGGNTRHGRKTRRR